MYTANAIRNICLLGHSGSGKTALAESLLYMTGAIDRIGKNADGNTVCDYDPEEIRRNISISTSVVPLEYHNNKINLLDTPGGFDFSGAAMEALRAADAAIIVCSAKDGITVGFEKAWKYCEERNMPRFIYISKVDEDNSDYNATFEALREKYGNKIAPVVVPIWDDSNSANIGDEITYKVSFEATNYDGENKIKYYQMDGMQRKEDATHNHVVRQIVSSSYRGDRLGQVAADAEVSKEYVFDIDPAWNLDNTYIYVLSIDADGVVNNMNYCLLDGGESYYILKQ